jgi:hypothetical protein
MRLNASSKSRRKSRRAGVLCGELPGGQQPGHAAAYDEGVAARLRILVVVHLSFSSLGILLR